MTFDYFLTTKIHSLDYSVRHHVERFNTMKTERRALLKAQKDPKKPAEEYYLALIKKVAL